MNIKALDDPALMLPRVMDVTGTFKRMGFALGYNRSHDAQQFTLDVQLHRPVVSERSRRAISHVHFLLILRSDTVSVDANYGYPTRRRNSRKLIAGFKELSDGDHRDFSVSDDIALRHVERTLKTLIHNLEHKVLDLRAMDDDGNEHALEGWEALSCAVRSGLNNSPATMRKHHKFFEIECWWISEDVKEHIPEPAKVLRDRGRVPNFDKRGRLHWLNRRQR